MVHLKKLLEKKKRKESERASVHPYVWAKAFTYLIYYSQDLRKADATVIPI